MPSRLVGEQGIDVRIPARLGAFFRDRDELTAASHLGATMRAALGDSSAPIVVGSPAAAAAGTRSATPPPWGTPVRPGSGHWYN